MHSGDLFLKKQNVIVQMTHLALVHCSDVQISLIISAYVSLHQQQAGRNPGLWLWHSSVTFPFVFARHSKGDIPCMCYYSLSCFFQIRLLWMKIEGLFYSDVCLWKFWSGSCFILTLVSNSLPLTDTDTRPLFSFALFPRKHWAILHLPTYNTKGFTHTLFFPLIAVP